MRVEITAWGKKRTSAPDKVVFQFICHADSASRLKTFVPHTFSVLYACVNYFRKTGRLNGSQVCQ